MLKRVGVGVVVAVIALVWINTRISMIRTNQNPAHPLVLSTYPTFQSMAIGLEHGRVGQVDLAAWERHSALHDPGLPFDPSTPDNVHRWVNYYTLDIGYSFIVEASRLLFPSLPDNHLRGIALQLLCDALVVAFVGFVFAQWGLWYGLGAALLYTLNVTFCVLTSFAFYYYWDVPLSFIVLGSMLLAYRSVDRRVQWLTVAAFAMGCGVWLRGSWWPLSALLCVVAATWRPLRVKLLIPVIVFAMVAAPQVIRSSHARGRLAFTTRAVWHVAMVGLGYFPNPYGLALKDETVFNLTRDKYGVVFTTQDYALHDEAARKEFAAIWARDRGFVVRSFFGRLNLSVTGRTESSQLSFNFVTNPLYRLLCLLGFVAMILRGGDKRFLALAAGSAYACYVLLTSLFYYVGISYDNVSQVTLFVLFIGGIEAAVHAFRHGVTHDAQLVETTA